MSSSFSSEIPPPLPPKQPPSSRKHQHQQSHQHSRSNPRNDPPYPPHSSRSPDTPPRTRPNRSQTTGPSATTNTSTRPQPAQPRRSHSSDSAPSDKAKLPRSKAKKSSIHADVIDRLDFTGVGPMFHHDGPFDACAPSRNRLRTMAPMYAWTSINAEDEEVAARYRDKEDALSSDSPSLTYNAAPYPSEVLRSPPVASNYTSYYNEPPKKKIDALAEAWGIHEPEPYEEFFAGGGDEGPITNYSSTKEARPNGRRTHDDPTSRPRGPNRIPPPRPIFIGDKQEPEVHSPPTSPISSGANISRNKSIMQRLRRMRDSPNVPVGFDEKTDVPADSAPSPISSAESSSHERPAHPRGHSILDRFPRGSREDPSRAEPYVYVRGRGKDLPPTPAPEQNYSEGASNTGSAMGRRVSIMKKVGRVVRGGK
ncbi:hypothetical protein F5148DRAFT_1339868 [Russula earlei]|uniref:Uncharacterized protein n=1 Tax=Russula earlei TaxID=71964 RepID=A0ACC0UM97_9AGAM|nr:hypothetical protein F5148DRAFT_1339868 [Russula earlei]